MVALAAACAVPGAAHAARVYTLSIGPLKARSYAMNMVPQCGRGGCQPSIVFSRHIPGGSQSHQYFESSGKVTATSLSNARAVASFGSLGKIDMTFQQSSVKTLPIPSHCHGTPGRVARGTATGHFRLKADSGYFGTVTSTSLPASVTLNAKLTCTGGRTPASGVSFGSSSPETLAPVFYATRAVATTTITATASENRGGTRITHTFVVHTGASHLVTSDDLSSAQLTGAGPLSGTVSMTLPPGQPIYSLAPLSGQLTGTFDSFGPVNFVKANGMGYIGTT